MRNTGANANCSVTVDGVAVTKDIYQGLMAYVPQVRGSCIPGCHGRKQWPSNGLTTVRQLGVTCTVQATVANAAST